MAFPQRVPKLPKSGTIRQDVFVRSNHMRILDFLRYDGIIFSLSAGTKEEVLVELVEPIAKNHPDLDRKGLVKTLLDRENLGSTGIGGGIAIPHGKFEGMNRLEATFGRSAKGVDFSSMDNKPAHLFFLLLAPRNSAGDHLKALARISRVFKDPFLKNSLLHAESPDDIYRLLEESDLRLP
jgi:nitrogen PTS system EIIA component